MKPGGGMRRGHVRDLSALYRQSVVAASAALETYVADAVLARLGPVVRKRGDLPGRLGDRLSRWRTGKRLMTVIGTSGGDFASEY